MFVPALQGNIDRRLLINFTADYDDVNRLLPAPFRPKTIKGKAIVGICLIRLKNLRPKGFPAIFGKGSENMAHRFAVEWDEKGLTRSGVYIPRRDTSSRFNTWVGGRLFPGTHGLAGFSVKEQNGNYRIQITGTRGADISVNAELGSQFSSHSVFDSFDQASEFFRCGDTGFSPNGKGCEGLLLHTYAWKVSPLKVNQVHSDYFQNRNLFGTTPVEFDNALLMTNIEHEWRQVNAPSEKKNKA